MKRLASVLLALLASGCAGEREVRIQVPLSRLDLPEQGPRMFGITVGSIGEARVTLTGDQADVAPDPQDPLVEENNGGLLRFDASPVPLLTLSAKGYDGVGGVQAKFLPFQDSGSPFSAAITVGYAAGDDDFTYNDGDTFAHTTIKTSLRDYALVLGVKVAPAILLYGGPYLTDANYRGRHFSDRGGDPDVELDYAGEVEARGANAGAAFGFGRWGRMLLEYSHAKVAAGRVEESVGQGSLALEIFFGKPLGPVKVDDADEPVEVVPPAGDDGG